MIRANCATLKGTVHERGGITKAEVNEIMQETKSYADNARQSATNASASLSNAQTYCTRAETAADNASESLSDVQEYCTRAETAASSASSTLSGAQEYCNRAETAADNASESLSGAQEYCNRAETAADNASESLSDAQEYCTRAETAADNASESLSDAQEYCTRAETAANSASSTLSGAQEYCNRAENASANAISYASSAETAAESAESALQRATQFVTEIDATLSKEGAAADAKEVGTRLTTVNEQLSKRFETSVLDELPQIGVANVLYIVPAPQSTSENPLLAFYVWDGKWVSVGGTGNGSIDEDALTEMLSSYYTKQQIDEALAYKSDKTTAVSFTIPTTGWETETGNSYYNKFYDIPVTGITANDIAVITISASSMSVAVECGLCQTNETFIGKIRIRSASIPTNAISAQYCILYGKEI